MLGLWVLTLEAGVAIAGHNLPPFKAIEDTKTRKASLMADPSCAICVGLFG